MVSMSNEVDAAGHEAAELRFEQGGGLLLVHGAHGEHQLTGRAEVTGDEAAVLLGDLVGDRGGSLVELVDAVAEAVHGQAWLGAAEGVGGEDAGAGLGVLGVDLADDVGVLDVPELA